jgi:hypothetical protein
VISLAALLGGAALVVGCPGSLTDEEKEAFGEVLGNGGAPAGNAGSGGGGAPAAMNCDAPATVFLKTDPTSMKVTGCASAGCHDAQAKQSALDLSMADPFADLLNKEADPSKVCEGKGKLIDGAAPEKSLLYTKMFMDDDPNFPDCGLGMPYPLLTEPPGHAAERACVLAWIKSKLAGGGAAAGGGSSTGGSGGAAGGSSGGGGMSGSADSEM